MAKTLASVFLLILGVCGVLCDDYQVEVEQGTLSGKQFTSTTGTKYIGYLGVRYAKPPVGELRFLPPQEPESWDGVRDASEEAKACIGYNLMTEQLIEGSEDCLWLNIYTTSLTPEEPQAVMVYFHGGEYNFESANSAKYGPDFIIDQGILLVTVEFRKGAMGYLDLGISKVSGNAALKDHVAALKWINANIGKFGGDSNRITIVGQGSGAASVGYHIYSEMSRGLYKNAVALGGSPDADWSTSHQSVEKAFKLGNVLGFNTTDANELLTLLQSVDANKLMNIPIQNLALTSSESMNMMTFRLLPFVPTVEKDFSQERFISQEPMEALDSGNINTANVMCGYTDQESLNIIEELVSNRIPLHAKNPELFLPYNILYRAESEAALSAADKVKDFYFGQKEISADNVAEFLNFYNNMTIVHPMNRFFGKLATKIPVYPYRFSSYSNRNIFGKRGEKYGIHGAGHGDELSYLFDPKAQNLELDMNSQEYVMIKNFAKTIADFVKEGSPQVENWLPYTPENPVFCNFGDDITLEGDVSAASNSFWDEIYASFEETD